MTDGSTNDHIYRPQKYSKILVFQSLNDVVKFFVKGSEFTLQSFIQDKILAEKYKDGAMAIIRLAPADYHRYHFPASGKVSASLSIKGHYYSVSPLALLRSLRIFCEKKMGEKNVWWL